MTKTICDICGKIILDVQDDYSLTLVPRRGLRNFPAWQKNYSVNYEDVCEDCARTICCYIKGFEKEN